METTELIRALNNCITPYNKKCDGCPYEGHGYPECTEVMISDAADRLEELDERVAGMEEGKQISMDEMIANVR